MTVSSVDEVAAKQPLQTDLRGIIAQEPGMNAVERAGPGESIGHHARALAQNSSRDPLDSTRHLGRGSSREGQQEDAARIGALDDQMSYAMSQGVGLTRSRAGDDQQRRSRSRAAGQDTVLHGLTLPWVQLFQIGWVRGHGRIIPVRLTIDPVSRFVRNGSAYLLAHSRDNMFAICSFFRHINP